MKKLDRVPREILHQFYEGGERFFQQKKLSETCGISLGTINPLIKRLARMGAIHRRPQGFRVVDVDRLLTYWAVTRDIHKDVTYSTYVPERVKKIESDMPDNAILTAYSGYSNNFERTPGDYDEVYVYADSKIMRRKFRERPSEKPNLITLSPDDHLEKLSRDGVAPLPQLYVDLWQLGQPAKRFVKEIKDKMERGTFKGLKRVTSLLDR